MALRDRAAVLLRSGRGSAGPGACSWHVVAAPKSRSARTNNEPGQVLRYQGCPPSPAAAWVRAEADGEGCVLRRENLESSDSMAWSFVAWKEGRNPNSGEAAMAYCQR